MLHIYRQTAAMREFQPVVFTQKRENAARFPFEPVVLARRPPTRELTRFWQKTVRGGPVQISRWEARRLAAKIARARAKVLHVYFGHIAVHLLPLLELQALPAIVSFHGADAGVDMEKPRHRAPMQRALQLARLVLVRSHSLADRLADLGCAREKIRLHRTGIPLEDFRFMQREPPPDGAWRLLQACRLIEKKGLVTTLVAFCGFRGKFPRATLTIAGEGPMRAELENAAAEFGLRGSVRFTGFLPQEELRALFYESHAFVHPSETGHDGNQEGVPNAMLEAMATGLPVLATTHGGIPEAVDSGVCGWLVPEREDAALENAMGELTADADRYRAMSVAAARGVAEKFELHAQVRALEAFYREAMQQQ